MGKRKRRYFSPEYKAEVVKLVHEGKAIGKSVGAISKELGLIETAVRGWVKKAEGTPTTAKEPVAATAREQELLREIRVLKMERDILKKAAAFFAKEST